MRRALTVYATLSIFLQICAGWFVHQMSRAWLDTFIYGYYGFAARSPNVHWMIRLSRLSFCIPAVFLIVTLFIIARHKSERALLHTIFAGLAMPLVVLAIGLQLFLAELTDGTWTPRIPGREDSSQQSFDE